MNRLTSDWTDSLVEAFGDRGARGHRGELFVADAINSWGWEYRLFQSEYNEQISGIDIEFRSPKWSNFYTADIKANIDDFGGFCVETDDDGWLFNPEKKSHRIWHCNPDTGWMAWYDRAEMQSFIVAKNMRNTGLYKVTAKDRLRFVSRRNHEVKSV